MAATTTSTEAPGGHGGFPPFQSENFPSQLIWLAVTFVLLYALMSRIALPRIAGILADRDKRIAGDIAAANRLKEQSDAAHAAYEKALADARGRAQAIANATREQQAAAAEATNKQLEAQLHQRIATAEQSITASRTSAMSNVSGIASDTAASIVERLIGQTPAAHEVAAAVSETLKR
jgi:F-type H+-transporting ATPase subunit b